QKSVKPSAAAPSSTFSTSAHRDEIYIDDDGTDGSGGRGGIHDDLDKDPDYSGSGFGPDDEDAITDHHQSSHNTRVHTNSKHNSNDKNNNQNNNNNNELISSRVNHHNQIDISKNSNNNNINLNLNNNNNINNHQANSGTIIGSSTNANNNHNININNNNNNNGIISSGSDISTIGKDQATAHTPTTQTTTTTTSSTTSSTSSTSTTAATTTTTTATTTTTTEPTNSSQTSPSTTLTSVASTPASPAFNQSQAATPTQRTPPLPEHDEDDDDFDLEHTLQGSGDGNADGDADADGNGDDYDDSDDNDDGDGDNDSDNDNDDAEDSDDQLIVPVHKTENKGSPPKGIDVDKSDEQTIDVDGGEEDDELYTDITDKKDAGVERTSSSGSGGSVSTNVHELDPNNNINSQPTDTKIVEHRPGGNSEVVIMSEEDRTTSFFAQPGILAGEFAVLFMPLVPYFIHPLCTFSAVIGGAVVGLLCAILVVMFIVYRMRKKDEGSYALDEPKRSPANNSYAKNANNREFYA
ncbi:hypothetical protein KR093_004684, partial [Drosophila rubida]